VDCERELSPDVDQPSVVLPDTENFAHLSAPSAVCCCKNSVDIPVNLRDLTYVHTRFRIGVTRAHVNEELRLPIYLVVFKIADLFSSCGLTGRVERHSSPSASPEDHLENGYYDEGNSGVDQIVRYEPDYDCGDDWKYETEDSLEDENDDDADYQ
jgi:hypothetical protein